jgi:predicted nucleic acid-binding protein
VSAFYLDASAVVKRYVAEPGSAWMLELANPAYRHRLFVARIASVEVIAALSRRHAARGLSMHDFQAALRGFRQDLSELYFQQAITNEVIEKAIAVAETHALRGYDSVQMAAALILNSRRVARHLRPLTFVSADRDLNAAVERAGLRVVNPAELV